MYSIYRNYSAISVALQKSKIQNLKKIFSIRIQRHTGGDVIVGHEGSVIGVLGSEAEQA